jgi:hypothetical protein
MCLPRARSKLIHQVFIMAFPNSLLSRLTWRQVGLGFTTTIFALGTLALVSPKTAGQTLGVVPITPEALEINERSMTFLGVRDVAVASTLFWFYSEGKSREMGVLLSSWVLVCVVDTWVAMKGLGGWNREVVPLYVGAAATAFIAAGLLQVP